MEILSLKGVQMEGNVSVIIPSLNPDQKLIQVVEGLIQVGFNDIILVNDGSDQAHMQPFQTVARYSQCTILTHEQNKGKGRALKTAFSYILKNRPNCLGVVTVDGDNQHRAKDIAACAEAMLKTKNQVILGCRDFSGDHVPPRSKFGNNMTSWVFRYICGLKISDTQTGLRAIPRQYLADFIELRGERFEYETNMLLRLKEKKIPFREVTIETVYIEENASSHFNPIVDSFKIYKLIFAYFFKFVFSSAASCLLDLGLYTVIGMLIQSFFSLKQSIFVATILARVGSSLFNFTLNQTVVFHSKEPAKQTIVKYYILCICQMLLSYGGVWGIVSILQLERYGASVIVKIIVDCILFLFSYQIQKKWIFKK